jgi:hypothetical protein
MDNNALLRETTGIVDRVEPDGVVFVHEESSLKLGFIANTTPVQGSVQLKPGVRLHLDVEDRGNVMVVSFARAVG